MRPERLKILLVFSALLMFAFTGELAAQATIEMEAEYYTVYYNVESGLRVVLDTGAGVQSGDTVLLSVISGDGSVAPTLDTTDASGQVFAAFTAGTTEEIVSIEAKWVNTAGTDSVMDTVDIDVKPAPTTLTIEPTGRSIVPGEDLTLTATLDGVIGGDTISFAVIGNGAVIPADTVTDASGVTTTTFAAPGSAEVDTVIGTWDDGVNGPISDTLVINIVNAPDNLYWNVETATLDLEDDQVFTARITLSGAGVGGLMVDFLVSPGLGSVAPESGTTSPTGYVTTTYTASTVAGTDTLIAVWTDEDLRAELTDTVIITINPGSPTSLNVNPLDTVVVVTNDAVIVAELLDDYLNHVDATSVDQVTFTSNGNGTFGDKSIDDAGCIEVAYTTNDTVGIDTITTRLVGHTTDYTRVRTIGGAPTGMYIWINSADTMPVVGGVNGYSAETWKYFNVALFDQYGNKTIWSDYYADETHPVALSASEGGGRFQGILDPWPVVDTVYVDSAGEYSPGTAEVNYVSSETVGVYTITCTSGAASSSRNMTQICDYPDSVVLAPDSIGIPAGSDTVLVATLFDQYGNYCPADDDRFVGDALEWDGVTAKDDGEMDDPYIEDHNWKGRYYCYPFEADTAWIWVEFPDEWLPDVRSKTSDTVVVFSAEPGDLHHFDVTLLDIMGENFDDHAWVSDGDDPDTSEINAVLIEAQDGNNIRLWTYDNPDTLTLTLDGSSAGASQVVWYIPDSLPPEGGDTTVGLTAFIAPGGFAYGLAAAGVCNQVAETVTITATDTAGHTGTSPALTWLPTEVVGFNVALEGGLTTITAIDDTVNMEVTAIDEFGNTTGLGLPLNVVLSATRPVEFLGGEMQLMTDQVSLFPMVATQQASDLVLRIADYLVPSINGSSAQITVNPSGIEESPVVSGISASFGSGNISYAVATDGEISIKVYNKVGMQVGTLVDGAVKRGYYQASLKGLNLSSDVYFVVMQGPGIDKKIKATLIK